MKNLLNNSAVKVILAISFKTNYTGAIWRKTTITQPVIGEVVKRFEEQGFLTLRIDGRKKIIQLTDKGEKLKSLLQEIKEL